MAQNRLDQQKEYVLLLLKKSGYLNPSAIVESIGALRDWLSILGAEFSVVLDTESSSMKRLELTEMTRKWWEAYKVFVLTVESETSSWRCSSVGRRRHFYLDYLRLMISTFTYSCRRTTCALFLRGFKGTKCRRTDAVSHMEQIRLDRQHRNEVLLLRTVDSRVFLSKVLRTKEGFSRSPVLFSGHPNSMRLSKCLNINKKVEKRAGGSPFNNFELLLTSPLTTINHRERVLTTRHDTRVMGQKSIRPTAKMCTYFLTNRTSQSSPLHLLSASFCSYRCCKNAFLSLSSTVNLRHPSIITFKLWNIKKNKRRRLTNTNDFPQRNSSPDK